MAVLVISSRIDINIGYGCWARIPSCLLAANSLVTIDGSNCLSSFCGMSRGGD